MGTVEDSQVVESDQLPLRAERVSRISFASAWDENAKPTDTAMMTSKRGQWTCFVMAKILDDRGGALRRGAALFFNLIVLSCGYLAGYSSPAAVFRKTCNLWDRMSAGNLNGPLSSTIKRMQNGIRFHGIVELQLVKLAADAIKAVAFSIPRIVAN